MPPEILAHQFESELRFSEEIIDVTNPEQVAYLLPYSGKTDEEDKGQIYVAINPLVGNPEEVHQLMDGLEHDLHKDLKGIELETSQTYTSMMFADKSGVLDTLSDPQTNDKIDRMMLGEIPGEIPSVPAIRLKADKRVLENPLLAEAAAALIGKQLEAGGRTEEAWLEDLTAGEPEGVCIMSGDYSLPGAITQEHHIPNLDKCIREEVAGVRQQEMTASIEETATNKKPSIRDDVTKRAEHMGDTGFHGRLRQFIGWIATGEHEHPPKAA